MIIFEFPKNKKEEADELLSKFLITANQFALNSITGDDIIQVVIPLTTLVATLSPIIIKLIEAKTCTIKVKGIEISGLPPQKALELIERLQQNNSSGDNNEDNNK